MLSIDRKEKIKEILRETRAVSVKDLSLLLHISTETVRRDLASLEGEGFLEKTHGGAVLSSRVVASQPQRVLKTMLVDVKRRMAREASKFVHPNDCIFLDNSTTVFEICQFLRYMPLTIVSNSLVVVNYFSGYENLQLITPGGSYNPVNGAFEGIDTVYFMQTHSFDKALISNRALTYDLLWDNDKMTAEIRKNAIKSSTSSFVLADHTKFNRRAFVSTCALSDLSYIITDKELDETWKGILNKNNVQYIECLMKEQGEDFTKHA